MDAQAKPLQKILFTGDRYIIPLFQRYYSWEPEHWKRLRDDVLALCGAEPPGTHFLGPMVCSGTKTLPGALPTYQLIDGQQRLTTLTLLLTAIRDVAQSKGLSALADKITECYLVHRHEEGLDRYRVVPRLGDRQALIHLIEGRGGEADAALRLTQAYHYFHRQVQHIARRDAQTVLAQLFSVVTDCLHLVVITIDGENPYEIFDSLNSAGLPLKESDLIRNFMFMQVPMEEQQRFHRDRWAPLEGMFAARGRRPEIDLTAFYRDYLMRDGAYVGRTSTFQVFREQNQAAGMAPDGQVDDLVRYAKHYLQIRRPATCDVPELRRVLHAVGKLDVGTAYPLVMHLMERHAQGALDQETLVATLSDLCSFVLRRSVCGDSTRGYGRWFVEAISAIGSDPRDDLRGYWQRRGWPDDESFEAALLTFPIYTREPQKGRLLLERLEESYGHKEQVDLDSLTVEHVMPQTIGAGENGSAWKRMLGDEWKAVHEAWLHALGNLTLTGYNAELGNQPYPAKRADLLNSHVELSRHFREAPVWDAEAIEARGRKLADMAVQLWPRPSGGPYRAQPQADPAAQGLSPTKRLYLRYWSALGELIRERGSQLRIGQTSASTECYFGTRLPDGLRVTLWAWQSRRDSSLIAGMTFRHRALARHVYTLLKQQASQVESRLSWPAEWQDGWHGVWLADRSNVDFRDEEDWEIQHNWLVDRLEELHEVIPPFVEATGLLGHVDLDTKSLRLRFWTGLVEHLRETGFGECTIPSPGNANWLGFAVGRSSIGVSALVHLHDAHGDPIAGGLSVELYLHGPKAEERYWRLWEHRGDIEAGLGTAPRWERREDTTARKIDVAVDVNLFDPSRWPEYHAWLHEWLVKFQQTFRPLVRDI